MTHLLMVLASIAFMSGCLCLVTLPIAGTSALAVVGSMVATIVLLSLVLLTHKQDHGMPAVRLSGRSSFV